MTPILEITTDPRATTVSTSTVDLGLVTLTLTARHCWLIADHKDTLLEGTFALDVSIGNAEVRTSFTWDASPDDFDTPETHMEPVRAIDIGGLLGIADPAIRDALRSHVLAHFDATCQREAVWDAARLPECETAKSAAKRQLIHDAKLAGYKADHSRESTRLTRGKVSVTVWRRGQTTRNHVRPDMAGSMSLAETRAYLGL